MCRNRYLIVVASDVPGGECLAWNEALDRYVWRDEGTRYPTREAAERVLAESVLDEAAFVICES